jgi:hypothetical protein
MSKTIAGFIAGLQVFGNIKPATTVYTMDGWVEIRSDDIDTEKMSNEDFGFLIRKGWTWDEIEKVWTWQGEQ